MTWEDKYREAMDQVEMSGEMRSRIQQNLSASSREQKHKIVRFTRWKQIASVAAVVAVLAIGVAYSDFNKVVEPEQTPELALPDLTEVSSLEDLEKMVGFEVEEMTSLPYELQSMDFVAYSENMAEVTYVGDSNQITFRKSKGSEENSGDYNSYENEQTIDVNKKSVLLKGSANAYSLALWTSNGYSYSLSSNVPLSGDDWAKMIGSMT